VSNLIPSRTAPVGRRCVGVAHRSRPLRAPSRRARDDERAARRCSHARPVTALLTVVPGQSKVLEQVHQRRSSHVAGLTAFGARISHEGGSLRVTGTTRLRGANVVGVDIRCAAALLIGALAAEGESRIGGMDHLLRGYADLPGSSRA
jgi:hypothetical protein